MIRKHETEQGIKVYVDSADPRLEDIRMVPEALVVTAQYIEAVGPDGRAYVLKDKYGERGPLARTTESPLGPMNF